MGKRSSNSTAWPRQGRPRPEGDSRRLDGDRAESLVERLADEMAAAWEQGERPQVEEFLARHPEIGDHPESAARLIYEEICLREGLGQSSSWDAVSRRFPQWRSELEILLDCHDLVTPAAEGPKFPEVGETLEDYRLVAELGRGLLGRVFLALQSTLADRPVVLKLTRRTGGEHLSMARLQHPHVMPLYAVHDFPDRDLRALCMPYLGGATLERIFELIGHQAPNARTGVGFLKILDQVRTDLVALPVWSSTRQFLVGATYTRAICWIGACLAEALHYAHQRGLLHLDLKPSNVLIADDGQPMLLDFHLAQGSILPEGTAPERVGGTRGYMSPEQEAAISAVREGRTLSATVDERSDVYSLGVMLFEALVGTLPTDSTTTGVAGGLLAINSELTLGLSDILARSLALDPRLRYPTAAALAVDLRRHLEHLPLQGVANRSLSERWHKWWRRHPLIRH